MYVFSKVLLTASVTALDSRAPFRMCNSHVPCVCCVATVKECVQNLSQEDDKENLVASLWGAERCLRVLESVSTALSSNSSLTTANWMVTFSVT